MPRPRNANHNRTGARCRKKAPSRNLAPTEESQCELESIGMFRTCHSSAVQLSVNRDTRRIRRIRRDDLSVSRVPSLQRFAEIRVSIHSSVTRIEARSASKGVTRHPLLALRAPIEVFLSAVSRRQPSRTALAARKHDRPHCRSRQWRRLVEVKLSRPLVRRERSACWRLGYALGRFGLVGADLAVDELEVA
jgi:hypothetical protein